MTYYNLSFMENTTGITGVWQGVNTNSNGWFAGVLLITLFILILMVFKDYPMKDVLLVDSFIMAVLVGLLFGVGLVGSWVLGVTVAVLAISLFIKLWSDA